jgi:putative ABC transport system permease protein
MKDIIKLALRNLKEHKSKTLIISMFILFGVAIVVLGNSFLESINRGLEKDFRANVTGDLAISVIPEKGASIDVFGVNSTSITGDLPKVQALADLERIEEILAETDGIKKQSKMISSQVILSKDTEIDFSVLDDDEKDLGVMDLPISMLFAGEDGSFWELFPDLNMIEGRYPAPGSNEIIVDTRVMEGFHKSWGKDLNVGDDVLMASMDGIIREAKVVGLFKPANEYSAMFQSVYCEPGLARAFADLTYANSFSQELPDSVDLSISNMSEDDFFGDDDFFGEIEDDSQILGSTNDFDSILGDTSLRDQLNQTDDGSWQYVLAKLDNPHADKKIVAELNKRFKEEGLNAQAMDWKKAAISYSGTVEGIGFIFNLLIIILAIVVFIIIMNTMVVSVIERTSEIGTMRAIGAEKKFVKKLFYSEAVILTSLSAFAGIIFAFICMLIFNSFNIAITNEIAKMILGGGLLHFSPTPKIIIVTILVALIGSILSNRYPVKSALRITPIKALSKE